MLTATIKVFLPFGDAKRLRLGEISNWTGKAVAAPRTDLDAALERPEAAQAGVYMLFGIDPDSDGSMAYIGEAEVIRDRLKQHRSKEFWISLVYFVSKDENLTKAHVRYLEARLVEEARRIGRYKLQNVQLSATRLPESDREDMEIFLARMRQLLPVLGSDLLTEVAMQSVTTNEHEGAGGLVYCRIKGAMAKGQMTPNGFVVFAGSTAVKELRPSAERSHPFVIPLRQRLVSEGFLVPDGEFLRFSRDTEFNSPSSAAAAVHGGGANGWREWKSEDGKTLAELAGRDSGEL